MEQLFDYQTILVTFIALILIPLIGYGIQALRVKIGQDNFSRAKQIVEVLVQAAEQLGLDEKKEYVLHRAEIILKNQGISIDAVALVDMLESAVWEKINAFEEFDEITTVVK